MSDMLVLAAAIDRLAVAVGKGVAPSSPAPPATPRPSIKEGWLTMRMTDTERLVLERVRAHPDEDAGQESMARAIGRQEGEVSRSCRLLERADLIESHRSPGGYGLRYRPKGENS